MQLRLTQPLPAPIAPKSQEILRAVRTAFVEKGFDGASMQDLARAANMSVGNFYRYFPSKDAIVAELIAMDLAEISSIFAQVITSPRPMDALRAVLAQRVANVQCEGKGQLWAEISAAAQRKPDIAARAVEMERTVASYLIQVFAAETGLSPDAAQHRFGAEARFVILLMRSAAMAMPCGSSGGEADLNPIILRTINQVLDGITHSGWPTAV